MVITNIFKDILEQFRILCFEKLSRIQAIILSPFLLILLLGFIITWIFLIFLMLIIIIVSIVPYYIYIKLKG